MAEKGRAALKTDRTNTYKAGVLKGTTVANCFNFMESIIDSAYNKVDDAIEPTKTFTTGGIATAYTVTDTDVIANSYLDGKPFFIIFNLDNTGAATIQFNSLPVLDIKLVGEAGKSDPIANQIKANVAYLATKETGVSEIYLRNVGSGSGTKVFNTSGSGTAYTVTDSEITANSDLDGNIYFVIFNTDSTGVATIQFNAFTALAIKIVSPSGKNNVISGTLKANYAYFFTKETGIDEIYISQTFKISTTGTGNSLINSDSPNDVKIKGLRSSDGTLQLVANTNDIDFSVLIDNAGGGINVYEGQDMSGYHIFNRLTSDDGSVNIGSEGGTGPGISLTVPPINDSSINTNTLYSSSKIEDRARKTMVPIYCLGGTTVFTVTLNYITVIGDMGNYFFVCRFQTEPNLSGSPTLTVNALTPIPITIQTNKSKILQDTFYLARYDAGNFIVYTDVQFVNDLVTNLNYTWSSSKIESSIQKALIPVSLTYAGAGLFTCSIAHITVLGDLTNYFYVFVFSQLFQDGMEIQVNSLTNVVISLRQTSGNGIGNYPYLARYDGTNFLIDTAATNDIVKRFNNTFGITEAAISFQDDGASLSAMMFYANSSDENNFFGFATGSYTGQDPGDWPSGFIKIHPPGSTYTNGALEDANGNVYEFPTSFSSAYAGGKFLTGNNFESDLAATKQQSLSSGATVDFILRNGFIANLFTGTQTTVTIDFDTSGVGANSVNNAQGYIIFNADNSIDVTFHMDSAITYVKTESGTNPVTINLPFGTTGLIKYVLMGPAYGGNRTLMIEDVIILS